MPINRNKQPFIGNKCAVNYPFVCIYAPFVGIRRNIGFTLIELIVTVAVVAITATLVIPNMRPVILNSRMTTQTNDLITDIQIARSEAIKRASRVIVCASSTGNACDGSGWSSGRLIYDASPTGADAPNNINAIRYHEPLSGQIVSDGATTFPDPLIFNARGTPIQANGRPLSEVMPMPVLFVLCDADRTILGRQMALSGVGQLVTSKYTC